MIKERALPSPNVKLKMDSPKKLTMLDCIAFFQLIGIA